MVDTHELQLFCANHVLQVTNECSYKERINVRPEMMLKEYQ